MGTSAAARSTAFNPVGLNVAAVAAVAEGNAAGTAGRTCFVDGGEAVRALAAGAENVGADTAAGRRAAGNAAASCPAFAFWTNLLLLSYGFAAGLGGGAGASALG